jgi:hypothetical protein
MKAAQDDRLVLVQSSGKNHQVQPSSVELLDFLQCF